MKIISILAVLSALFPTLSSASEESWCRQFGINLWGVSWHSQWHTDARFKINEDDRVRGVNEVNPGIGVRCYIKENWLSDRPFLEINSLQNSYWGVAIPIAAGAEYEIKKFSSENFKIRAVGTGFVMYYENRVKRKTAVYMGAVPGLSFGTQEIQLNLYVIPDPRKDREHIISVAAASVTYLPEKTNGVQLSLAHGEVKFEFIARF